MDKLDVAKGYKTISGLVILAVSLFAQLKDVTVDMQVVNAALEQVGVAVGALLAAYGLIMKLVRSHKSKK